MDALTAIAAVALVFAARRTCRALSLENRRITGWIAELDNARKEGQQ